MTRLIDVDVLPRHGNRGGIVQWHDIEKAPTVDAIPIEWIFDWENRYMNALPPEFQGETVIELFMEDWRKEQEKQNESTV